MDFYKINQKINKNGTLEIYPEFIVNGVKDLMVRGGKFYAIWDDDKGLWSTDEYDVVRIIDNDIRNEVERIKESGNGYGAYGKFLENFSSSSWMVYKRYVTNVPDNYHTLDSRIIFSNTDVTKKDYVSRKLSYPLECGDYSSYEELVSTLYSPEERAKLEWAIGSIIAGDSKKIQKFIVLYGDAGAGKSTILNIIQMLFEGYYASFDAKALTSNSNIFSTEAFKDNPLVAIQHDGDLSKIEDNTKLNSIVSHEEILINEKHKSTYSMKMNCFLFMATNTPVKITNAKSGVIRRLIDVRPTGEKVSPKKYHQLMNKIPFELGAIAYHCLEVYENMGKNYYNNYKPVDMMYKTDPFFNFVEDNYIIFDKDDGITLTAAYKLYKEYCEDSGATSIQLRKYTFREELKNYFAEFHETYIYNGTEIRGYYKGFLKEKFDSNMEPVKDEPMPSGIIFEEIDSLIDEVYKDCPAQYSRTNLDGKEVPNNYWSDCETKLYQINTKKLHYVKIPHNHIVIDFDIKDENGNKSFEKNLEAANKWPSTYAELSKSEAGIHLHYIYDGDVDLLSRVYDKDIEIKIFSGDSSLRRKLTKCNNLPIAHINSGLPLKGEKKVVNFEGIKNEKAIRTMIVKNLHKEYHANTKPSVDYIYSILEDAYKSGMKYDVSDLYPAVYAFASNSTNQSETCLKLVRNMRFKSDEPSEGVNVSDDCKSDLIAFYDVEVFQNLFIICWKLQGQEKKVIKMINPKPIEVESLLRYKLVGFNNRKYDNHILHARIMGYSNEALFKLSMSMINDKKGFFGEAYNYSYTDIFDYAVKKQSLKKWEIELGISHVENAWPWDKPVPEDKWMEIADYCANDVIATEATWEATQADFEARKILAAIAGGTVNDTTNSLTTKIIFGNEKHPKINYFDLSKEFPGYKFVSEKESEDHQKHNLYNGEDMGFGGLVYSVPGMHGRTKTKDCVSQHPTSAIQMNAFGEYTKRFADLLQTRVYIKHKDFESAKKMFDGKLAEYLDDPTKAKALSNALKLAINSVYGLTSASFDNPFKHPDNVNNIVALRGALFMATLRDILIKEGYHVLHIKTDSIKIVNPTKESDAIIDAVGKRYGYTLETEHIFERICLVDKANYVAKLADDDPEEPGKWTVTGDKFANPFVFKSLFSHEELELKDYSDVKSVKTSMYLDMNEGLPDVSEFEELRKIRLKNPYWRINRADISTKHNNLLNMYEDLTDEQVNEKIAEGHNYIFIGRVGQFIPVKEGCGGGVLLRYAGEDSGGNPKYAAVEGTKDWRWKETEVIRSLKLEDQINMDFFRNKLDEAIDTLAQFGDVDKFLSDEPYEESVELPWDDNGPGIDPLKGKMNPPE